MRLKESLFRRMFCFSALAVAFGFAAAYAQDQTLAEIKYKEDYDRLQKIIPVKLPVKRLEQLLAFYKERSDADTQLRDYADNFFVRDMESLMKERNYIALRGISEKALSIRPKFGEAYLFYGIVLKNEGKIDEAMNAFAKCSLIKSRLQSKGKQQLDIAYRARHHGSLVGEDQLVKDAQSELK